MAQLAPTLQQKIVSDPDAPQQVIVRVNGNLDARGETLEANGFQIRRKLGLVKGFAATAPGAAISEIARQPWVTSIEEDQQVHTM